MQGLIFRLQHVEVNIQNTQNPGHRVQTYRTRQPYHTCHTKIRLGEEELEEIRWTRAQATGNSAYLKREDFAHQYPRELQNPVTLEKGVDVDAIDGYTTLTDVGIREVPEGETHHRVDGQGNYRQASLAEFVDGDGAKEEA